MTGPVPRPDSPAYAGRPELPARPTANLGALRDFLRDHLLAFVIPFWDRHAVDRRRGGILTCLDDAGRLASEDKWMWSQWRAVWVYARLFNSVEPRPEWRKTADDIAAFCARHGWDEQGGWRMRLSGDGAPLDGPDSLFADAFAISALTQLARVHEHTSPARSTNPPSPETSSESHDSLGAHGSRESLPPLELALHTARHDLAQLARPHAALPTHPYPTPPGARAHSLCMLFSLAFHELATATGDERLADASRRLNDEIFERFHRPDRDLFLEYVTEDGDELDAPRGRVVVPGHAIEDMWFQILIARERGEAARVPLACRLILRHLALGWDEEFGGLRLAVDADGAGEVDWGYPDSKLWWPHTEAMVALLLAYEETRDPTFLEWFDRVFDWAFRHFPVWEHGEWRQKLDRRGRPFADTVALPVKDPFHLPRALILCVETLDRLTAAD